MRNKVRLPAHVKPEHYKITLKPDLGGFTFSGEEIIDLILEKPTKQIILHSAELEIESALFICQNQPVTASKTVYDTKKETVIFSFPKTLPAGKAQLKLNFLGILNDKMRGFYKSKYELAGETKHLATTQFEATDARRAFPCFDEPHQKAVFKVTLIIPAGTKAISNTIETEIREHESGYKVVEFAPTPKMSTYLLAFIVGDFDSIEGKSARNKLVRIFTTPGKKEQAKFALEVAAACLDFYENYFDIPYPLPVLDLIAIPDFAAGAMENWGAITYRESTLLIDEERSSTGNKQWVALVIAHELAHQWFGNLVTMSWWSDLWLNEGFASFIEYLAIDHIFPRWDIWTQFVATEMGEAFTLDALKNTHPIQVEVGHPAEISEIFDKVSYAKGAAILRMLWQYLGGNDFQKGLQHYLKKYSYGNAQTKDLWSSLEEVSGKPVTKIMRDWTLKPGHPLLTVTGNGKKLRLTQSRFFSSPISKKQAKDKTVWNIPMTIGKEQFLMNKKSMDILDRGEKLNTGETSFIRVDYPYQYLKRLEEVVKKGQLSAPDRLGLVRDSFDLAQSGNSPTTQALELVTSYEAEKDYTVWAEITARFSQLDSLLAYEQCHEYFKSYGRKIYLGIAQKLGWERKKNEKHTDSLLRGMVLYKLGSFGDKETIKKARELFFSCHPEKQSDEGSSVVVEDSSLASLPPRIDRVETGRGRSGLITQNDKSIDPDLRSAVYNLVAENGKEKEFNALLKMYKQESNQQEKERIGKSLGLFKSKKILQKTLKFAISKHVRFQNSLQIIASVWGNPEGRYLAWGFVKENFKILKERYAGGHYFARVFGPAGEFTRKEDAKDIASFVRENPAPEAKRTIAQVLEQIYSNAQWLKRDREGIKKFLSTKLIQDSLF